jgi:hypothetical protein
LPNISKNILPSTRRTLYRIGPTSQTPYQILVLTDVILIGVNGWGIHPLREATVFIIVGELNNTPQKMLTNQAWLINKYHFHNLPLLVGSTRSNGRRCPSPRRLATLTV